MTQMITPEQASKFKELFQDYEQAVAHAGTMLRAYGMESRQFLDADKAVSVVWHQLRELQGTAQKHRTA